MIKKDGSAQDVYCLVLEYAQNGELFSIIANTGALPEKVTRFYLHQLLDALEYMHA